MKTEFKIQIPEGMEIDRENSTFECIKFKPKKLTYIEVSKKFPKNSFVLTNADYFLKLVTFRKLHEVADYLNGDWKPDWENKKQIKYSILYDHEIKKLSLFEFRSKNLSIPCFSSKENALKAIDIIGEEELRQFFL